MSKEDKLISVAHLKWNVNGIKCGTLSVDYLNWILDHEEPAVDAVPVRHGKWTADEALYTQGMTACSCCKTEYYRDDLYMVGNDAQGELPNYCPNCGARMDADD